MSIYFIYIPSPIIEVEVLCTLPCDTRGEFKIFYKKYTGILLEITLGNIKKEKLKLKKLAKSNK